MDREQYKNVSELEVGKGFDTKGIKEISNALKEQFQVLTISSGVMKTVNGNFTIITFRIGISPWHWHLC